MQQLQTKSSEEFTATPPAYKGDGVAVWLAKDKNGKEYLRVKILNGKSVPCFAFEPKPKTD